MDKRRLAFEIRAVLVSYRDAVRQRGAGRDPELLAFRLRAGQLLDGIAAKLGPDADYELRRLVAEARGEVDHITSDTPARDGAE